MFVGREKELKALEAALTGARLVTLWGPGGAGKTTLARRGATPNSLWVELASARTRDAVVAAFAAALAVEAEEGAVVHAIAARGDLVIADNAEQLDPNGRAFLAELATPGVAVARGAATLLVTSRDALGVAGEVAIEVAALAPDEALALYTQIANAPPDDDARAIVTRLDALPLAIELAAARAPLLGSAELRARLERSFDVLADTDRGPRHATLHAAIAWSWELLDPVDRDALASCALFEAPFDAALAEAAIGERADAGSSALDALERLRKRALLQIDAGEPAVPRLRLFESVRTFARPHVRGVRLRNYALAVLARVEPLALAVRRGEAIPEALGRRRADLVAIGGATVLAPDLRARALLALAALQSVTGPHEFPHFFAVVPPSRWRRPPATWPRAETDPNEPRAQVDLHDPRLPINGHAPLVTGHLSLRLIIARGLALRAAGKLDDAAAAAAAALEAAPDDADALRLAGMVARARGDTPRALALLERALAAYRAAGEEAFAGITLGELGAAAQSAARLAEGIAVLVATKSLRAEGLLRSHLAVLTHRRGDPRAAIPLHEAALAIHRRVGNKRLEGAELLHLGFVQHEVADAAAARAAFAEARRTLAAAGAIGLEAFACILQARLDADSGDLVAARIALAEGARLVPAGWHRLLATHHVVAGHLALASGDKLAAAASYAAALAASSDVEVGFEALTPAYAAFSRGEPERVASHISPSSSGNPHLVHAFAILTGAASTAPPEAIASSSDVRRAIAFAGKRALILTATSLVLPDGRAVDLGKRKNIRHILAALAAARRDAPGTFVSPDVLIAAGWPNEKMRADAATKRLHTAIWTLRKLGLEEILNTNEDGYRLSPEIALSFEPL